MKLADKCSRTWLFVFKNKSDAMVIRRESDSAFLIFLPKLSQPQRTDLMHSNKHHQFPMPTQDFSGLVKGVLLYVRKTLLEALNTWLYPLLLPLGPLIALMLFHLNNNQGGKKLECWFRWKRICYGFQLSSKWFFFKDSKILFGVQFLSVPLYWVFPNSLQVVNWE